MSRRRIAEDLNPDLDVKSIGFIKSVRREMLH